MTGRLSIISRLIAVLAFVLFAAPVRADDAGDVRGIITGQIEAFKADDGAKAYSFASPEIHMLFPNSEVFMGMVKNGYAPVYRPQQYQFGEFSVTGFGFRQLVEITDAEGNAWIAEYSLARGKDGELKVTGCRLIKRPGVGA